MNLTVIFCVFFLEVAAFGQKVKTSDTTIKKLMDEKLVDSQNILKGLALEDFKMVEKNAEHLKMLAKAASWHRPDDPDFQHYYKSFQNGIDNISSAARSKNLEGVALSYMQLTFACMQCHKAIRK